MLANAPGPQTDQIWVQKSRSPEASQPLIMRGLKKDIFNSIYDIGMNEKKGTDFHFSESKVFFYNCSI